MQAAQIAGESPPRGYELRVLVLLGLAYGFAYFDRMAMTFLAPFVQKDLELSNAQIGWLGSALSATWALGAYFVGRWSDSIGRRKPFLLGAMVLFSLCSVFSGLSWSFGTLFAARVVMGAAEGPFLPICLAIMIAASAESRKGLNAGIVQNAFGSILGTAIAPLILVRVAEALDWRWAFYISGIPGLLLAVLIWWLIREPKPVPAEAQEAAPALSPWSMLGERNIWVCSLVSCFAVGTVVVGSIFMPLYMDGPKGMEPKTWSNVMAVVGICPAVGGVVVTWLSDRFGRRPLLIVFAFLMALSPAALLWFDGPVPLLTAMLFVSWMGLGTFPLFMGVIPAETLGRARAATAMGLVVAIGELSGGVFGPPIAGWLGDEYGLAVPLYVQMGLAILAGLTAFLVTETNPRVIARRNPVPA
ncbi:MFS transporter [Croceibacterium aestuarii]|uniref:MFS transporter n=1 Tax=Croceibacterium aestuarii TaxID=3064139 RepID=UPI00272EBC33|nr:MFS transporter [Croceibacterium sp. D39]